MTAAISVNSETGLQMPGTTQTKREIGKCSLQISYYKTSKRNTGKQLHAAHSCWLRDRCFSKPLIYYIRKLVVKTKSGSTRLSFLFSPSSSWACTWRSLGPLVSCRSELGCWGQTKHAGCWGTTSFGNTRTRPFKKIISITNFGNTEMIIAKGSFQAKICNVP